MYPLFADDYLSGRKTVSSSPVPSGFSDQKTSAPNQEKFSKEIQRALKAGDFKAAEILRDTLINSNSLTIVETIQLNEQVEKAMSAAVDKGHLAIWPDLYKQLTIEERNRLFHSMKKYVLPEKKLLLKYGSMNNRLFFIEQGSVTVAIPQAENKFKILAQLGRGDVLGEYSFATIALCSATAVTKTAVQLRSLESREAERWEEKFPGLYEKVLDFCKKFGRIEQISEDNEKKEHTYPRFNVPGQVRGILLDKNGQETELSFNGELQEISRSGTSFIVHCNQRSTIKEVLARSFSLLFCCGDNGRETSFSIEGKVVRVSSLLYNDYLLHIGFNSPLPAAMIDGLTV